MAVGGGLILGTAALWLLSQLKKPASSGSGSGTGAKDLTLLTTSQQIAAIPFQKTTVPITAALDWVSKNPVTAITIGLSLFAGISGAVAGIAGVSTGIAGLIVAVVVEVIIAAVVFIGSAIQNNDWERAATTKGRAGLLMDYVALGSSIAQTLSQAMIDAGPPQGAPKEVADVWPSIARAWASYYGASVIVGYNQVSAGLWGASPSADISYWEDRAMFVQLPYMAGFESRVAANILLPAEQPLFASLNAQAKKQAQDWGLQFGRVLWAYLCARKSMIEPWQYDWSLVAEGGGRVGEALGVSVGGPAGLGSWAPRYGANMMMLGLYYLFGGGPVTGQFGQVQNIDVRGNWTDPSQIGGGATAGWQVSKTLAYPYMVDWDASSDTTLAISSAPVEAKPAGFGRFRGQNPFGRFGGYVPRSGHAPRRLGR